MMYLILAYKRIPLVSFSLLGWFRETMQSYNRAGDRRFLIKFSAAGIGVLLTVYLVALYVSFGIGFLIQQKESVLEYLTEEVLTLEFSVRQSEFNLVKTKEGIVQSMERVSAIKYIPADESVAVSAPLRTQ